MGLKPVGGEAAEAFWVMKRDDAFRRRVVGEARARLEAGSVSAAPRPPAPSRRGSSTPRSRPSRSVKSSRLRPRGSWCEPRRNSCGSIASGSTPAGPDCEGSSSTPLARGCAPTSTTPGPTASSRRRQRRHGRTCGTRSASSSTTAGISSIARTWRCSCRSSPTKTSWVGSARRSGRCLDLAVRESVCRLRPRPMHRRSDRSTPRDPRAAIDLDPTLLAAHTGWTSQGEDLGWEGSAYFRDTWLIRGMRIGDARTIRDEKRRLVAPANRLVPDALVLVFAVTS